MEKKENNSEKGERLRLFRIGLTVFLTFVCCIIFYFVLLRFKGFAQIWSKIIQAATPIIVGLALAYIFNPVMLYVEKKVKKLFSKRFKSEASLNKFARIVGVIASVIILLGAIGSFIAALTPVYTSVANLVKTMQYGVPDLIEKLQNAKFSNKTITAITSDILQKFSDSVEDLLQNKILPQAQTYVATITKSVYSFLRGLFNFIIGIIVMVYVMTIQDTLRGQAKKIIYSIFKPEIGNLIIEVTQKTNTIFGGFIFGKILDSIIIGIIAYAGCCILGIPSALLVALFIGITNVIPVFGPFIGAIPSILLVLIQSPLHALYLLIFVIILQQVDGNIIGPKILGSSTGLSSFWVMFAILIGGGLFGFMGMLLGVPVFATIYYIIRRVVSHALRKKGLSCQTEDYINAVRVDVSKNKLVYFDSGKIVESKTDDSKEEDSEK